MRIFRYLSIYLVILMSTQRVAMRSSASSAIEDFPISEYPTPKNCLSFYTVDRQGVALECSIVSLDAFSVLLDILPSRYTQSLSVTCTSPDFLAPGPSFFKTASLALFHELGELILNNCRFLNLSKSAFARGNLLQQTLHNLTIQSYPHNSQGLALGKSSISQLRGLVQLILSNNNLQRIPDDELCPLDRLTRLVLNNNNFTDLVQLGYATPDPGPCNPNLMALYLSHNRISALQNASGLSKLPSLVILSLRSNDIAFVEAEAFSKLRKLALLDLSFNRIEGISGNAWRHLRQNLVYLNLSHNALRDPLNDFAPLRQLEVLDLSFNHLEAVDALGLQDLPNLAQLLLSNNKIIHLPEEAFFAGALRRLTDLHLEHNQIASTISNKTFQNLGRLQVLWLNNNPWSSIAPDAFRGCPQLQSLNVFACNLTRLFDLSFTPDLVILDAGANQIQHVDDNAFAGTPRLIGLRLSGQLTTVSAQLFRGLSRMSTLDLSSGSGIREIHARAFESNANLAHLFLQDNQLVSVPNLTNNQKLVSLHVSRNRLTSIDYTMLPGSLQSLNADDNRIEAIGLTQVLTPVNSPNVSITHMNLSHNRLTSIGPASFPPSLQTLDLSYNHIEEVEEGTFNAMKSLQFVDLTGNAIKVLNKQAIIANSTDSKPRFAFALDGNPLACNCDTFWMKQTANLTGQLRLETPNCWVTPVSNTKVHQSYLKAMSDVGDYEFMCKFQTQSFTADGNFKNPSPPEASTVGCADGCSCYRNQGWSVVVTHCGSAGKIRVPQDVSHRTTILYLDGNAIVSVNQSSFSGEYPGLRKLYFNHSSVRFLEGNGVFSSMSNLEELHLEGNALTQLGSSGPGVFEGLGKLQYLDLSFNELRVLATDVFEALRSLRVLRLRNNELMDFLDWRLPVGVSLSLDGNPWRCDCDSSQRFREWLQKHNNSVADAQEVTCSRPATKLANRPLLLNASSNCSHQLPVATASANISLIGVACTSASFFVLTLPCLLLLGIHLRECMCLTSSATDASAVAEDVQP